MGRPHGDVRAAHGTRRSHTGTTALRRQGTTLRDAPATCVQGRWGKTQGGGVRVGCGLPV